MTVVLVAIIMLVSSRIPVRWSGLRIGQRRRVNHDTFRSALCADTPARGLALCASESTLCCEGLANSPMGRHGMPTGTNTPIQPCRAAAGALKQGLLGLEPQQDPPHILPVPIGDHHVLSHGMDIA